MTTGIIILGITAVLLFFGAAERYFDRLGMTSWLAFLIILALIIGAVMPEVRTNGFVMTVGGFVVPAVVFVVVLAVSARKGNILRTLLALAVQAALTVAFRMFTGTETTGALTAFFLLTGFIGGAAAYAIAGSRLGCVAAIFGGCIVGDAASMGLLSGAYGFSPFTLGGYGIFNAMIVGCAASLLTAEIVCAVRRSIENRSVAARRLEAEAAEDVGAETKREEPGCDADDNDIYGGD